LGTWPRAGPPRAHSTDVTTQAIAARVTTVLEARTLIERAKGALAYTEKVGMAEAYDRLAAIAAAAGQPLTVAAAAILEQARNG
jgi:AmiR/NasT family two-component response regulator